MKNFNLKLYFQALKKLRLLTLASLAVSLLIIILYYSTLDFTPRAYGFSMYSYSIYRLMLVFAYVGGFFFTAITFSFLLRRSRSDFYHSIPVSRSCVLITNLSAVLTSTMAVIIVSFVADAVAAMWVYQINSFDFLPYKLCEIFGIIAVMLAVCGCTLMGLSFAGDIVTSTLFSVLAACAPRLIFDSCVNTVFQGGLNLSRENLPGIFAPYLDLVSQPIIGVLKQNMQIRAPDQMENVIFTLVLAIIYLIIGSLLFLRRKSEHAESPALSFKKRLIFKGFLFIPLFKSGVDLVVTAGNFPDTTNNLTPAISLILFSVVVYFAYDLIVTKSILALPKSFLGFFIMAALTVALSIFSFGLGAWRSGIIPEAKQIKSVSFYNMVTDRSPESFVEMAAENVEHTDSGLIDLCITSLKADASFQGDYGFMELKLNDGSVLNRRIRNVGENNELQEAINKNPDYISALTTFPQAEKAEIDGLTGDESSEIINIYCKEIQEAGNISLLELSYGEPYIHIESAYKGEKTNDYFSVDTRAPRALEKYLEYFENNERIERLLKKQNYFVDISRGSTTTSYQIDSTLNSGSKELVSDFKEIVGKTVNRTPSLEYKLAIVGVTLDDQSRDNENVAYVLLTNNEQAQIERLQEKLFQLN